MPIRKHIMEALNKPDTNINEDYDFWNAARQIKTLYLKFCGVYQNGVRIALAEICIIPKDESQPITAKVKGIILEWRSWVAMAKQDTSDIELEPSANCSMRNGGVMMHN